MASTPKKSIMKKEKVSSTRTGSAKQSGKDVTNVYKEKIEQYTKQNEELIKKVDIITAENRALKDKLHIVSNYILEDAKRNGYDMDSKSNKESLIDPSEKFLSDIVQFLRRSNEIRKRKGTVENRIEELETRITHLNTELAKMVRLRFSLENGLEEIQHNNILSDIHRKARFLLYELQGNELFTFLETQKDEDYDVVQMPKNEAQETDITTPPVDDITKKTMSILQEYKTFNLKPPVKKLPGDTHLKNMDLDLKKYLIHELSLYKGNGADWRMIGERVGIPVETIQQWKRWKVEHPMEYVFNTWKQSAGATVRMLHRHLVSPQMRSILLAKRISDFYQVE